MGRRVDHQKKHQTTTWYIHAYLHVDDRTVLPVDEAALDALQFGGKRNYGYGDVDLKVIQILEFK